MADESIGHSFTWAGVYFGDESYSVFVENSGRWPVVPQPRVIYEPLATANGSVSQGSTWERMTFDLNCTIYADDKDTRDARIEAVAAILRQAQEIGEQELSIDYLPNSQGLARLNSGMNIDILPTSATFRLSFVVTDPGIEL